MLTWVLTVAATAPSVNAPTKVHIDLGNTPAAGSFDPTNVAAWDALTLPEDNCEYSAGAMTVPTGTFSLTLTALDGLPDAPVAHGTLHVQMHVASPPGVDCGAGDTELVDFTF